jgi:2-polyprenyl-3-methyl-5-hydroxy-6-metoxy-1,4-benzoquinol methylase
MLKFLNRPKSVLADAETETLVKDYSLQSGERQVGRTIDAIRKDHLYRYELAAELIRGATAGRAANCLDLFCGNGYGSYLLAQTIPNLRILGIDGSREAIDVADDCYSLPNNMFVSKPFPFQLLGDAFEFVTCFESLEHVEDDASLLRELFHCLRKGGIAMISVPNQDRHPLEINPHKFHFRHYRHEEFLKLIPSNFVLQDWYGQDVYEFTSEGLNTFKQVPSDRMALKKQSAGQVNIYIVRKLG